VCKRGGRDRLIAEAADQREVARHHGDLTELRERDRQRELDRLAKLVAANPLDRGTGAHGCIAPGTVMAQHSQCAGEGSDDFVPGPFAALMNHASSCPDFRVRTPLRRAPDAKTSESKGHKSACSSKTAS
jgi:hypothetical protein